MLYSWHTWSWIFPNISAHCEVSQYVVVRPMLVRISVIPFCRVVIRHQSMNDHYVC